MSTDRPDDTDDLPTLRALPPKDDETLGGDYGEPPHAPPPWRPVWNPELKPGFGFWMAVAWCILFFVATQIVIGLACGVPIIIVAALLDPANRNGPPDPNQLMKSDAVLVGSVVAILFAHLGGLLFAWLVLRWQVGRQWKRKVALSRRPTVTHALLTLVGLVAMLAVGACVSAPIDKYVPSLEDLLHRVGIDFPVKGAEMIPELIQASPLALALFTVGVMPAFDEEFWCRGFIAHGLSQRYAAWAVVLMTSFLFGCLHVDPRQGLGAMFLGVAMHFAYLATRSLWVPMALHFLNNSLAVVHIYFKGGPLAVLQPLEDALEVAPVPFRILFVATSLLLFAAVAYALYQTRCKLVSVDPARPAWRPEGVSSVELPPADSGTVVTHDPISPVSVGLVLVAAVGFGVVLAFA
jgi:CAAX protease family protein